MLSLLLVGLRIFTDTRKKRAQIYRYECADLPIRRQLSTGVHLQLNLFSQVAYNYIPVSLYPADQPTKSFNTGYGLCSRLTLFPELTDSPETATIHLEIMGEAEQQAQETREQLAAIHEREACELARMARQARQLAGSGYNYRDIAYLLGISYGRGGQILKTNPSTV